VRHDFSQDYWDRHWDHDRGPQSAAGPDPNPYLARETSGLVPGTALDAGCGEGAEALWLAARGWQVTAADIAAGALDRARDRAARLAAPGRVDWVRADLTSWAPATAFDLVLTCYAHAAMPQLAFYRRIAEWVAPGGTLLIIGHLTTHQPAVCDDEPPEHATVTAADITAALDGTEWDVVTAGEHARALAGPGGPAAGWRDAVVRATRRR
jgi:SAM-dependent methyltransferase